MAARIVGELCHFVDWARAVVGCPMQTVTAAALPDAGRYHRDNVTVTIRFEDGSLANLLYVANGDRAVAKEYFEVFCGGSIARMDDFKTLSLSRNGKTETLKSGRDKGHRREMELTIEAMRAGQRGPDSLRRTDRGYRGHFRHRGSDQNAKNGGFGCPGGRFKRRALKTDLYGII